MRTQTEQSKFDTDEHILVCLSSSPSNAKIVHTAAKMAKVLHARFTAIYVQTPWFRYSWKYRNHGHCRT